MRHTQSVTFFHNEAWVLLESSRKFSDPLHNHLKVDFLVFDKCNILVIWEEKQSNQYVDFNLRIVIN